MRWLLAALFAVPTALVSLIWLRVAQREHYLPGSCTRFWFRWLRHGRYGPSLRGRTSKLAWTRRLRTVAAVVWLADLVLLVLLPPVPLVVQPLLVDGALFVLAPIEQRVARRFVASARARLEQVGPTVVAITGSFGKTSTKQYLRHLVAGSRSILASPASFNNTAGLSRTVNEQLTPGTEVFVAEMGTYGPGEIRGMCAWLRPSIGVIVNIGPVHLERMKSLDEIVRCKSEILETASIAVLNVDAHGLAAVADDARQQGKRVVRCSCNDISADVCVSDGELYVAGGRVGPVELGPARPDNVACAVGVALTLDVPLAAVLERLGSLPAPEHRQQVATAPSGVTVIDNTFSSNPASAAASLDLLGSLARPGHAAVVVTPGMVELGSVQDDENRRFGAAAGTTATHLVVVGRTNRRALEEGARETPAQVITVPTREDAVQWVRTHLTSGDVVLYENDLPDTYP